LVCVFIIPYGWGTSVTGDENGLMNKSGCCCCCCCFCCFGFTFAGLCDFDFHFSVHIGNLLGAGEAKRAFVTAFAALYAVAVIECILAIAIWSLRFQLIQLWSQGDSHLEAIGGEVIAFVALAQILGIIMIVICFKITHSKME
jgi:hypothetical protein